MEKILDEITKAIGPVMVALIMMKKKRAVKRAVLVEAAETLYTAAQKIQGLIAQIDSKRKLNQQP
jgi:hypothetical protein